MTRVHIYNAGPAALPFEVLEQAQAELLDFQNSGMSVMELSHRSPEFDAVHNDAVGLARELLGLDDQWQVLHTPGHASDHLVLWEPVRRLMVAGDMVASEGTIVVVPPDGHMATYVSQLERLADLEPARLIPAHGRVIDAPVALLRHYIDHRLEREARVAAALGPAPRTLMDVTRHAYPDVPAAVHPLASYSALAHLLKLEEEGRAAQGAAGWWSPLT